jgi:hypothetical protein
MLVVVMAVAPARRRSFCQFLEIDLKKIEPKWLDKSDNRGTFEIKLLNNFNIGFLSKTDYKMLTHYWGRLIAEDRFLS